MTNTLKATSIRAAKAWSGDSDDAWVTRPDGDTWSVAYLLQRRLGDGEWEWVVPADADPIDEGDSLYGSDVITRTISGSGNHADIELTYLPACDASGTAYSYRLVERVPGSYDVQDADAVDTVATEPGFRDGRALRLDHPRLCRERGRPDARCGRSSHSSRESGRSG